MHRDRVIEIVAAQRRVAVGREHFEDAAGEAQDRDVESAAAQVEHGERPLALVIEAVGDCRSGGLVQQAQHVQPREACGVLRRLALRIVEVGGHGHHGAGELSAERAFGAIAKDAQDVRRNLHRRARSGHRLDRDHAGCVDEAVRKRAVLGHVGNAAAHETLHRHDRIRGIVGLRGARVVADIDVRVGKVAHDRRQQGTALLVRDHFGGAAAHRRGERVRRAQVDSYRAALLVRATCARAWQTRALAARR